MYDVMMNNYGNPSSLHTKGLEAERLVRKARNAIASTLGVQSSEVFFTSGGTESNNLAIIGCLEANPRKGKHLITTKVEHPSVLEVFRRLSEKGYEVDYINVDEKGIIRLDEFREALRKDTAFVSIQWVNNETGSIQPVEEAVRIKNTVNNSAVLHVDAVQAYGKLKINPVKSGVDILTVSSHKIHGPKGAGALYVNSGIRIKPVMLGGGQESLLRSGTENVPVICGFGLAAEIASENLDRNMEHVSTLKKVFLDRLMSDVKEFTVNSPEESSPYIINVSFAGIMGEVLLHHLEQRGIYVSTGSACSSRKNMHSHVLKAMGMAPQAIEGAVRFSFSVLNDNDDINCCIEALKEILHILRKHRSR